MSRIEELPDDFDESLDLNKKPAPAGPTAPANNDDLASIIGTGANETPFGINEERLKQQQDKHGMTPQMPPGMASVRSHTADEIVSMMNKTPLFMTDLSDADMGGYTLVLQFGFGLESCAGEQGCVCPS